MKLTKKFAPRSTKKLPDMNRAVIIHGTPSKEEYYNPSAPDSQSNSHWLPWLQQRLCQHDILTQAPEMPTPYDPKYEAWKNDFEKQSPDENTLLIGHSCGSGFIVRWLSENPEKIVSKVVLVAPWLDVEGDYPAMFEFTIRSDIYKQVKAGIEVLYSTDDQVSTQSTVNRLRELTSGLKYHEFTGYRHFTFGSMKTREFPELLKICLGE